MAMNSTRQRKQAKKSTFRTAFAGQFGKSNTGNATNGRKRQRKNPGGAGSTG